MFSVKEQIKYHNEQIERLEPLNRPDNGMRFYVQQSIKEHKEKLERLKNEEKNCRSENSL